MYNLMIRDKEGTRIIDSFEKHDDAIKAGIDKIKEIGAGDYSVWVDSPYTGNDVSEA